MSQPLQVTVFDPETGESSTGLVESGNYMVICNRPCYLDYVDSHANGTTVLTIKGRNANLMHAKDLAE